MGTQALYTTPGRIAAPRADWAGRASLAILAAGTIAVYRVSLRVPLLLDDHASIADNLSIRRLWPLWPVLAPPSDAGVGGRPLFNLSYALNYSLGGTEVAGYHRVNLLIHLLAAWVLFALVRRTLLQPVLRERFGAAATSLALAASAFWAWHPVQTEAVTYLSERSESLMGLFYLLTLYGFVRSVEADRVAKRGRVPLPAGAAGWVVLTVSACLLGVATKEVMVTAPVIVLLYDRTFISGGFSVAWRRHRALYLALAATWILLGCLMVGLHHRGVGFGQGVAWWAYGLTESRVVLKYLLLCFWPHPLVFDYGLFAPVPLAEVWPYAFGLALLVAGAVFALWRVPMLGFVGCWFFLILAPTSSFVPVATQPMAESRLYLPLAAVAAFSVLGVFALAGRRCLPVFAAAAVGLGLASIRRNHDYASAATLWTDTVAKVPSNPRARDSLGDAWSQTPGRLNDAIVQFEEAVRLKPDFAEAHYYLGTAWANLPGRTDDAIGEYREALRLEPNFAAAHYSLGYAWSTVPGRLNDAIAQYQEALRLSPNLFEAHTNLGNVWLGQPGHLADATVQYQEALRLRPESPEAHYNLGNAWANLPERSNDAVAEYERALRLRPDYAEAHNNLANLWSQMPGQLDKAVARYEEALRLKPDYAEAHFNLAVALLTRPGGTERARAHLEAFLRLQPGNDLARQMLAKLPASRDSNP